MRIYEEMRLRISSLRIFNDLLDLPAAVVVVVESIAFVPQALDHVQLCSAKKDFITNFRTNSSQIQKLTICCPGGLGCPILDDC